MQIFHTFKDTDFVKNSNKLQKKIETLEEIQDRVEEKEKILTEIEKCKLQLKVENQIEYILKNSSIGMIVLKDIYIQYGDQGDWIDYVIVTPAKCYLVSCKSMIGNLEINQYGEFHNEYTISGETVKEKIYSPSLEANRHKDLIKKIWESNNHFIKNALTANSFDEYYTPLIIYGYPEGKINASSAPYHIKSMFTISSRMLNYFQKEIDGKDSLSLDSESKMREKADLIRSMHQEKFVDYTEGYTIPQTESPISHEEVKDLYDKLYNYRNLKARVMNIKPAEVMTDVQLRQLAKDAPHDIITLQGSYILEPFKLELHGAEILNIINGGTYTIPEMAKQNNPSIQEKEEEDAILSPEMVLQVEAFAKKIDIKNSGITSNYGASSLNKAMPVISNLDLTIQNQVGNIDSTMKSINEQKASAQMIMVELYMYLSAGKKAVNNSKMNELPILQANQETNPGIANELALSSYNSSLANMEKQMTSLEKSYKKLKKYIQILDTLYASLDELKKATQRLLEE